MNSNISVVVIYGLIIIFAILSIGFLTGKGKTLFVGQNTTKEPRFSTTKLSKVVGMCFSIITVILFITALIWNVCPEWYQYFFWVIIGGNLPGRFLICPDLAASGLWSTPKELLVIAKEFVTAFNGRSGFMQEKSAREMAKPVDKFPWTGIGVFMSGKDTLMSQGWGESGQCMMKMNCRTEEISVVMTNRNPEVEQAESGVEWLVNRKLSETK